MNKHWSFDILPGERTRSECSTHKVSTPFGNLYAHVEHANGRILGVRISHSQKHEDTTVGDALDALGRAITGEIEAINARWSDEAEAQAQ